MDFATLSIGADTSELKQADKALEDIVQSGARAEAAAEGVENAIRGAGEAASSAAKSTSLYDKALSETVGSFGGFTNAAARNAGALAGATKLTSNELTNLAFQFQDFGVQVASGGNPLVALVQQGSQVSGVMMQAGLGVKGLARELAIATGIIKVSGNASLEAAAASARANVAAISSALQRAQSDIAAARAEELLARAAIANATTAEAAAAAQVQLAQATNSAAAASGRATVASEALARANMVSGAASEAASAAQVTSLGRLGVAGLAAAGALAVAAGGVALLTKEVNDNADVTVSWQNVLLGAYDVIAAGITDTVGAAFDALGLDIAETWDFVVGATKTAFNLVIGILSLPSEFVRRTFPLIGPAIGEAFYAGADIAAAAFNVMANTAANTVNAITGYFNEAFGTDIPRVVALTFERARNPFAGASERLGRAASGAFVRGFTGDFIGDFGDAITSAAVARQLGDATKEAGEKAGRTGGRSGGRAMGRAMGEAAAETFPKAFLDAVQASISSATGAVKELADAYAEKFGASEKAIAALQEEVDKLGLSEAQLRQNEIANLKAAAATEEQRQEIERLNIAREEAISTAERNAAAERKLAAEISATANAINGLGGLVGGRFGASVRTILDLDIGLENGTTEKLSDTLAREFNDGSGKVGAAIRAAFQGAQIGGAVGGIAGSTSGGSLGGALGSAAATQFLGKALGSFAGPIGGVVGGILGGIVGGLLKGTPRASATIEVIAGDAMQTAVRGNSGKLKGIATGLADSLIGGLESIASQLGGELGSFGGISIGVRNKTFRVDPTGQGRTKGLPAFATEEEAIREALRIAISRGAITGIRAGTNALLQGFGDLETQLSKALAFEGVFERFQRETDPLNYELGQLQKEFDALRGIFAEAGATAEEYAQLEQLLQIERNKITERYTTVLNENGEAIQANIDAIRERQSLEVRLLELQGNAVAALALSRKIELDQLDPTNRALAEQVFALEDQAEALRVSAEASEALAQAEAIIAQERFGLETRLLQLQGDTAAIRERELAALDPSNRALLANIFALEDQTAAANAAAEAALELARIQDTIAQERFNIEGQILRLLGDTAAIRERELAAANPANQELLKRLFNLEDEQVALEAAAQAANALRGAEEALVQQRTTLERRLFELTATTAQRREAELAALDPTNRALLDRIFAVEDERAALEAATVAASALAEAERRITDEREGLETRLLQLIGDTTALRQRELDSLDPSNRALLERVFALQDDQEAAEAATRASEALANAQRAIADEISGLNRQLLQAQGNTAALRALDLAALRSDEARAIQREIFAIEDARAAQEALAEAQAEAARSAEEASQAAVRAAEEARRAYEELLQGAQDDLRRAVAAERSLIEARLDPLRNELERLVAAITPEAVDIVAAMSVQDFLSEGLSLAEKLADASRGVLGDTEKVVAMQREAAKRELFRMVETRRVNEDIIDRLISEATAFGNDFANPVDLLREQAQTANLLAELGRVQEEQARAAQDAENARAVEARELVLSQIDTLRAQIAIEEAQLSALDATLERFGLLNDSVLSVADAVRQLESVTRQGFGIADPAASASAGGPVFGDPLSAGTGTNIPVDLLRQINNLIVADKARREAEGRFGGFGGSIADPAMFEALVSGQLVAASLSLATLAGNAAAILEQSGGDLALAAQIISGEYVPGPAPVDAPMVAAAQSQQSNDEVIALLQEQNEYLVQVVKNSHDTTRTLKEMQIEGETV